jgi:hypothetical protein
MYYRQLLLMHSLLFQLQNTRSSLKGQISGTERRYIKACTSFLICGRTGLPTVFSQHPRMTTVSMYLLINFFLIQQCGDFGFHLVWISFPPMKLCSHCLLLERQFSHITLREGLKYFRLKKQDVKSFPILVCTTLLIRHSFLVKGDLVGRDLKTGQEIILRQTLASIAAKKGFNPPQDDYPRYYQCSGPAWYGRRHAGFIRQSLYAAPQGVADCYKDECISISRYQVYSLFCRTGQFFVASSPKFVA